MNYWLIASGVISVMALLGHHFAGGAQVLKPSMEELKTEMLKVNMRFQFVFPTLIFATNAVVYFGAGVGKFSAETTIPLSSIYVLSGLALFWCGFSSTEKGAVMKVFPWILFLVAGALGFVGVCGS